ncbi:hypothetical protein D3C72_1650480 [compost metagenome]
MSPITFDHLLGQRLLTNQQIVREDLDRALAIQQEKPSAPQGEILIGMNVLTREALTLAFLQLYAQVNASDSQRIRWARGFGGPRMGGGAVQPGA